MAVLDDQIAVTGHRAVGHLDAHELAPRPGDAHLLDRVAPGELPLGRLHHPAQPRFDRVRGLVDVVAIERVAHLEAQGVARAEPDGCHAVGRAPVQQRAPHSHGVARGQVELEAVLTGVPGARDHRLRPGHVARPEPVVADRRDVAVGEPAHERFGLGSLHRDQRGVRRDVAPRGAAELARLLGDPGPVLVDVGGVDGEHEPFGPEPVEREVVDDAAVGNTEQRVLDLSDLERADVVGGQDLQRGQRLRASHLELAHVADVEEADGRADRAVLLDDARVLHGHLPSAERNHARACGDVCVE